MNEPRPLLVKRDDGVREYDQYMYMLKEQGDTVLRIPNTISYAGALGRSVSFAQLIATWASTSSKRRILTWLPAAGGGVLGKFVKYVHSLSAAYYADEITAEDGKTNLKELLIETAVPRIHAMSTRRYHEITLGRATEFVFARHSKWSEFHSVAYKDEPSHNNRALEDPEEHGKLIVEPEEMQVLVQKLIDESNMSDRDQARIKRVIELSGKLLHETFRNTAEHAYPSDISAEFLRCILIAVRRTDTGIFKPEKLVSAAHPDTDKYFEYLRGRSVSKDAGGAVHAGRELVQMLEISVLDTGPGLSKTIAPYLLDTNTEDSECVTQCFLDHVTSKPGLNSGLGLGRVLSHVIDLGGFLRMRTSTTEAFLSSHSCDKRDSQPVPHVVGNLAKATGTAITIAVPLERTR